jgi:hypothetical protein
VSKYEKAIAAYVDVPPHIHVAANVVRYDLLYGPSWIRVPQGSVELINDDCLATYRDDLVDDMGDGDILEEAYTGLVSAALRDFIDSLPSMLYVDTDSYCVSEFEPDSHWDTGEVDEDTGESIWEEQDLSSWYRADRGDIVCAIFGKTIEREFK